MAMRGMPIAQQQRGRRQRLNPHVLEKQIDDGAPEEEEEPVEQGIVEQVAGGGHNIDFQFQAQCNLFGQCKSSMMTQLHYS